MTGEAAVGDEDLVLNGDIQHWLDEVRRSTVAEFTSRHRGLFLLVEEVVQGRAPIVFETIVPDPPSGPASNTQRGGLYLVPIAKSDRNPYQDRISIGRTRNCDIVIRHPSVSKLHAHLRPRDEASFTITDLDSHNGTRVNDRVLRSNEPAPIVAGDVVIFGLILAHTVDATLLHGALSLGNQKHFAQFLGAATSSRRPVPDR